MTWRVRDGELPLSRTLEDPKLHYGRISTTQKDGTPPFPRRNAHRKTLYSTWSLLLDAQSSCVVLLVVLGFVRCLRWKMGTKLGRSQLRVKLVGRFSRARTVGTPLLSRLDAAEPLHLPCLEGQVWFPGATHRAIKRCPKSVEAVMEDCTESHQTWNDTLGEQSRDQVETTVPAAMGPCAPSELVLFRFRGCKRTRRYLWLCRNSRRMHGISWIRQIWWKWHSTNVPCTPRHAVCTSWSSRS